MMDDGLGLTRPSSRLVLLLALPWTRPCLSDCHGRLAPPHAISRPRLPCATASTRRYVALLTSLMPRKIAMPHAQAWHEQARCICLRPAPARRCLLSDGPSWLPLRARPRLWPDCRHRHGAGSSQTDDATDHCDAACQRLPARIASQRPNSDRVPSGSDAKPSPQPLKHLPVLPRGAHFRPRPCLDRHPRCKCRGRHCELLRLLHRANAVMR
ncbi:hypothetical protein IWZ03DRAFT_92718 [Phyllosticta citriasiana]|uniref:Secreted protein n=1 Tax=Phyllosticta citriasiana TaxID=595635 RepID=A0ABR1K8I5_9PEZI